MTGVFLRAGQLNRLVSIQQRVTALDSFGAQPQTWIEIKKVYAYIEALGGSERAAAESVSTDVSHKFTVRYDAIFTDPKVAAAYRIVYANRIFDIQACLNADEANRIVELLAMEGMTLG
ncbi:phage head closure protein [Paraburkholderia panacisoli]|uniref:Phage head closure protein n=1 Tax=Paraburkholderia panacisoli TaxID=2603818 RepID=A0A5B0HL41_9BURK|nr:phage head closure protein [Paraburkholderia panacisoli]KAA1015971.1 phage head closure protein [Paraburkholderia panacisoli]